MSHAQPAADELRRLRVDRIDPNPRNPRENFEEEQIRELAESIDAKGLLQPVLVRPQGERYELVHGERRLRAVESLGRDRIKAEVRDLDDGEALEVAITENLQREDMNPLAEARGYRELIDEFDLTQAEAADRLGVSQSKIANQLRLLDLPEVLQENILRKIFTPWQARELNRVWGEYWIYDLALDHNLSVAELRDLADDLEAGADVISVEKQLSKETLSFFLGEPDDAEHQTLVSHGSDVSGDKAVQPLGAAIVDSNGEPIELLPEEAVTHGLLWMHHNVDGRDCDTIDKYDEWKPRPIKIDWPGQYIIPGFGYHRLHLAEQFDYTDALDVELLYPTEFFEWEARCGEVTA